MKRLLAIGEALIDFIPNEKGKAIKNVGGFSPVVGGAPANVCGAFSRLGGSSAMITQLGEDGFGDKIVEEFLKYNIGTEYVFRTKFANTSLAFVALKEDGNREFSFYRNPGADMLLDPKLIEKSWFKDIFALHFCSVSLGDFPMRNAHVMAINYTREANNIVSFDPNLRFALWETKDALKRTVDDFVKYADIVKISDEEVEFITGCEDICDGVNLLFSKGVKVVVYTKGSQGAKAYTKNLSAEVSGINVDAVDTTGAGDGFIGAFLYKLYENGVTRAKLDNISGELLEECLDFANKYGAISVTKKGALPSYVEKKDV